MGAYALSSNTTADNNVGIGYHALLSNTTGTSNVVIGTLASDASTTASENTAVGYAALTTCTTGGANTAIGYVALQNLTTGTLNTAVGNQALTAVTTGNSNVGMGREAGDAITTGSSNTAIGTQAITALTTGSSNTAVGKAAGENITTGSQNVILGGYTGNHQGLDVRTESDGKAVVSDGAGDIAFHNAVGTAILAGNVDVTGDSSSANAFTLANGATVGLFGAGNAFSGVFILNDFTASGEAAIFISGGGVVSLVGQTGASFGITSSPATNNYGVFMDGTTIKLTNNRSNASFRLISFRTRTSN